MVELVKTSCPTGYTGIIGKEVHQMGKICNFIWNGIIIQCPDFQLDFLAAFITNTAKYYLSIDNIEMYEETARLGNKIIKELQVYQRKRELMFSNINEEWED